MVGHYDDAAKSRRRHECLRDVGLDPFDLTTQRHRSDYTDHAQAGEGVVVRLPMRDTPPQLLACRLVGVAAGHIDRRSGFADAHQLPWIDLECRRADAARPRGFGAVSRC